MYDSLVFVAAQGTQAAGHCVKLRTTHSFFSYQQLLSRLPSCRLWCTSTAGHSTWEDTLGLDRESCWNSKFIWIVLIGYISKLTVNNLNLDIYRLKKRTNSQKSATENKIIFAPYILVLRHVWARSSKPIVVPYFERNCNFTTENVHTFDFKFK